MPLYIHNNLSEKEAKKTILYLIYKQRPIKNNFKEEDKIRRHKGMKLKRTQINLVTPSCPCESKFHSNLKMKVLLTCPQVFLRQCEWIQFLHSYYTFSKLSEWSFYWIIWFTFIFMSVILIVLNSESPEIWEYLIIFLYYQSTNVPVKGVLNKCNFNGIYLKDCLKKIRTSKRY